MHVIMVKKRLADGGSCRKCGQAEDMLKNRGLWERVDEVVWADELDADSEGQKLAQKHGVDLAPFFIIREDDGRETVFVSAIKFVKEGLLAKGSEGAAPSPGEYDVGKEAEELERMAPAEIVRHALLHFGRECAISFSGAEDVVLIDLAVKSGLPFSVLTLDTGRLHPETLRFIDRVRKHYGVEIDLKTPDPNDLEPFVRRKGLFSFYEDGHQECCGIRKVKPLARALSRYSAWMTGQRKDQSVTRSTLSVVTLDGTFNGKEGPLPKYNPLANWSSRQVWDYIRDAEVPHNDLHKQGYVSIGCEPCTRAIEPGEHERAGRWWWEKETQRECGLHLARRKPAY